MAVAAGPPGDYIATGRASAGFGSELAESLAAGRGSHPRARLHDRYIGLVGSADRTPSTGFPLPSRRSIAQKVEFLLDRLAQSHTKPIIERGSFDDYGRNQFGAVAGRDLTTVQDWAYVL